MGDRCGQNELWSANLLELLGPPMKPEARPSKLGPVARVNDDGENVTPRPRLVPCTRCIPCTLHCDTIRNFPSLLELWHAEKCVTFTTLTNMSESETKACSSYGMLKSTLRLQHSQARVLKIGGAALPSRCSGPNTCRGSACEELQPLALVDGQVAHRCAGLAPS